MKARPTPVMGPSKRAPSAGDWYRVISLAKQLDKSPEVSPKQGGTSAWPSGF
jgi:hypothetical protein